MEVGNLYTGSTFQILFHSFPQTRELKTAVFFFHIGWAKERLKEDTAMGNLFLPSSLVSDLEAGGSLIRANVPSPCHSSIGLRIQSMTQRVEYMALVLIPFHSLLQLFQMAIKDTQGRMETGGA